MTKKDNENIVYKNGEGGYIFISHSHYDFDKVRIIRNTLEENGYEPLCFYLKCLNDDDEVEGLIKREIDSRDIFLYIESENSKKSKWVTKERKYINSCKDKTIFKIILGDNVDVKEETLKMLDKTRVFISYSLTDKWAFDLIKRKLIAKDLKVFDYTAIKAGDDFAVSIVSSINQVCDDGCFVTILSKESIRAAHIKIELGMMLKKNADRILVVTLDDLDIESDYTYQYLLKDVKHHANLSSTNNVYQLGNIVKKIKKILSKI